MSGGRRKSRKPQKWEDYVADEEQLASIEKELVKEEKARMKSASNDGDSSEKSPDNDQNEDEIDIEGNEDNSTDEEEDLEISIFKEEEKELEADELNKKEISEDEKVEDVREERPQSTTNATGGQVIGDCTVCGIQLRDWTSTHSHLRFHRLSHVPDCNYGRKICQVCHRCCQNKEVLAYHAYTEHYVDLEEAKTCPFCTSKFKDMEEFQEHLDMNVISFKCQMCGVSVNQEHKFYQHIVYCAKRRQPGITSLECFVCGVTTSINKLHMHLMQHSTLLSLPLHLAHNNKRRAVYVPKPDPPRPQQSGYRPFLCEICDRRFVVYSEFKRHLYSHFKSRSYICTHCGRSYCQKNTLIVHLYSYHNSSPNAEEITPREDTTQRSCELCGLSGFLNDELLIRHCILRCSQRNNLQTSFAAVVCNLAKKQNMGFSETLRSNAMQTYLKLGVEAWKCLVYVKQYLERLQASSDPLVPSSGNRRDSTEFTDVQLLAYLNQFEALNRNKDKELELLLNIRSKDNGGNEMEILTFDDPPSSTRADLEMQISEREDPGTEDPLSFSPCISRKQLSRNVTSNSSQVDLSCLMQHLRKGSDKRSADEEGGEGGPIDICLVTSTTNTQVTITPAGCHQHDIRPPKVARSVSHKPSVAKIQSIYPGITVLSDVDFSRIPSIVLEMQEIMSYRVQKEMAEAAIIPEDLQRLEVEAQLLREAEPFYLEDDGQWQLPKCNGVLNRSIKRCSIIPEPSVLSRIIAEASVLYNSSTEGEKHVLEYPEMDEDQKLVPGKIDVEKLLMEAQNLIAV
ncbi:zinc finger and BTB domain-containing protein 41 isoform X2 [Procambarus clarkii]|uniref:zinc finger and BTB domain-containing protein 41 isoform X2 n=1 Tax=Procambarus clarkii TaxID=6728 RepID=UPI001E673EFA|nr:uncharacterized protein LOC123746876 isoform X2 [Procambarus clarkii]